MQSTTALWYYKEFLAFYPAFCLVLNQQEHLNNGANQSNNLIPSLIHSHSFRYLCILFQPRKKKTSLIKKSYIHHGFSRISGKEVHCLRQVTKKKRVQSTLLLQPTKNALVCVCMCVCCIYKKTCIIILSFF